MAKRRANNVTPLHGKIDVRALLLDGQCTPQTEFPASLNTAIDRRARALAEEAYRMVREHLVRRVGFHCETGYPERRLNLEKAHAVIQEGDLGDALTREFRLKLENMLLSASMLQREANGAAEKIRAALADRAQRSIGG